MADGGIGQNGVGISAFISQSTQSIDHVAQTEAWNNFTDALCKAGKITVKQYEIWVNRF